MKPTVIFDVNETLLDLSPVREWFTERFSNDVTAAAWFSELLRLSFVSATVDRYVPFPNLARAALQTVAATAGHQTSEEDLVHIGGILASLPPHTDAAPGLQVLRDAGYLTTALTNSPLATAEAQLTEAGLADLFDTIMSVDMVLRFKPHATVYQAAAERLGTETERLTMVAAHDWDIAGAMAAGLSGVFVARPGATYSPAFLPPTMVASDILDAAHLIIGS